jgi:serine/threonine-protein kinase
MTPTPALPIPGLPPEIDPEVAPDTAETIRGTNEDTKAIGHLRRAIAEHEAAQDAEVPTNVPPPQVGDVVGHVKLLEPLGSGASCFVFRAFDEKEQMPVAVKIMNWANTFDRTAAMRQMRTEAAAIARVKHPRVVRFHDFGFDRRWPYLVTEYVEGRPLGDLIRGGGLPLQWSIYIISQMVDALGAVWRAGLVHRDIKPDNILVGPDGSAKLIDFGLAKQPVLQAMAPQQVGPELAGTASYLAPEQARDASVVDLRADIYSLGVTFFEALTGRLPFDGRNRMQHIFHHLNTLPPSPTAFNPQVPPLVADLCLWMLVKNPAERPQDYDELRQAFDAVAGV